MPLLRFARGFVGAAALLLTSALFSQTRYAVTDLGGTGRVLVLDPFDIVAINAGGQAAYFLFHSDTTRYRATVFRGGEPIDLDSQDGETSGKASAINDAGDVAGGSGSTAPASGSTSPLFTPRRPFIVSNGTAIGVGSTLGFSTSWGINNLRQAIYESGGRAFLFADGTSRDLGSLGIAPTRPRGINDTGQIVGFSTVTAGGPRHAFLWENGIMRDLGTIPGGTNASAENINVRGQIVGYSADAAGANHAFLYENGAMRDLGIPAGATESRAFAINSLGQAVGFFRTTTPSGPHAFIYRDGAMIDLNTLVGLPVPSTAAPGFFTLSYATSINDAGQIAGIGSYVGDPDSPLHAFLLTPVPTIQPANLSAAAGSTVQLTVSTSLHNPTSFEWQRNGVPLPAVANGSSLLLPNLSAASAGSYRCLVSDGNVRVLSDPATLSVATTSDVGRLTNLSIRSPVGANAQPLIVGVTVGGTASATQPLLVRAIGPGLANFGVNGVLADPQLGLYSGAALVRYNDNWDNDPQAAAAAVQVGAFALAPSSKDAALLHSAIPTGSYTVQIAGANGGTGLALAEIYDATPAGTFNTGSARLTNISARAPVGMGSAILVAGFTIGGSTGKTVLIRAIGPTLASFNVPGALADPRLEIYKGSGRIAENDDWGGGDALAATFSNLGAFRLERTSKDSALLITLPPGSYTVQVAGVNDAIGVALIEIYELP